MGDLPGHGGDTAFVRTSDGRRFAFCEWGDPDGAALFYLHGVPGSRYLRHVGSAYADARLRVLTYDRPGNGLSDPAPGRSVADSAADVAAIADHLGLDRFPVAGVSMGGVHALAVAAVLPERVTRCVGLKALAPYGARARLLRRDGRRGRGSAPGDGGRGEGTPWCPTPTRRGPGSRRASPT
jgi:pimeloyl-ACP methyl ester carboxylesterase